jgi:hypothetical protein
MPPSHHLKTETNPVSETLCFVVTYLEFRTTGKAQKPSDSECCTPSSERVTAKIRTATPTRSVRHGDYCVRVDCHGNHESHMSACFRATWLHQMALPSTRLGDAPFSEHTPCAVCGRVKTAWRWSWNLTRRLRVCWRPRQASPSSAPVSRHASTPLCAAICVSV